MKRVLAAGLLALPTLLASAPTASAQYPGAAIPAAGLGTHGFGGCSHLGCGGFCFRFLAPIHFHGPLFNYGPYTGYYPFEPYGPWNAQLQYTGPRGPLNNCADGSCGSCGGCRQKLLGRGGVGWGRDDCGGCGSCGSCRAWGGYAKSTLSNVLHRTHPFSHKCKGAGCESAVVSEPAAGCLGCAGAAVAPKPAPVAADVPTAPTVEQAFAESPVEPVVVPRRER